MQNAAEIVAGLEIPGIQRDRFAVLLLGLIEPATDLKTRGKLRRSDGSLLFDRARRWLRFMNALRETGALRP